MIKHVLVCMENRIHNLRRILLLPLLLILGAVAVDGAGRNLDSLTAMSIEELMDIEVVTASSKPEKLFEVPSAAYVITAEDIRRSGLRSLPELLRMVPGMNVARVGAHTWSVSARGFNRQFADKLLVLVDGRSVYNPLFSGVYWEIEDMLLEDVERIEVIRGPGATVWGANAVNGVVNIITRKAGDTQGGYAEAGTGTVEQAFASLRLGGRSVNGTPARIYLKNDNMRAFKTPDGKSANDDFHMTRGGMRMDGGDVCGGSVTMLADLYEGRCWEWKNGPGPALASNSDKLDRLRLSGGDALVKWDGCDRDGEGPVLQAWYSSDGREEQTLGQRIETMDFSYQQTVRTSVHNDLVFGLGERVIRYNLWESETMYFAPADKSDLLHSFFVQHRIALRPDFLYIIPGVKVEHNDWTGLELQPGLRLLLQPTDRFSAWVSASRVIHSSTRFLETVRLRYLSTTTASGGRLVLGLRGNPEFKSEELIAWEAGFRLQPERNLSFDAALFANSYDNLKTYEAQPSAFESSPVPHLAIWQEPRNLLAGSTYGGELCARWKPGPSWQLDASYSFLKIVLERDGGSADPGAEEDEDSSPRHQAGLRLGRVLSEKWTADLHAYYVDELPAFSIPPYLRLDANLNWRLDGRHEARAGVRNILDDSHPEAVSDIMQRRTEAPRDFYVSLARKF